MDSSKAMQPSTAISATDERDGPDELVMAVALLFRLFARAFGNRWRATFEDPQAPMVWERKSRALGISATAVRAATGPATSHKFPPSVGEFVELCRPAAPLVDSALREALAWHPDVDKAWSHPAIAATAKEVGHWRLHSKDDHSLRPLFGAIYQQMLDRHARGERLDVPVVRALPAEIRTVTPRGAGTPESVRAAIAGAARVLGRCHD